VDTFRPWSKGSWLWFARFKKYLETFVSFTFHSVELPGVSVEGGLAGRRGARGRKVPERKMKVLAEEAGAPERRAFNSFLMLVK
jgi:hypothetical protein